MTKSSYSFQSQLQQNQTHVQQIIIQMQDPVTEFKQWYLGQPLFTRTYITGAFILACLTSLKIISPFALYYTFDTAILNLEIWRLATALFFQGKFSFNLLFSLYFCYFAISKNQIDIFQNHFDDFLWLCTCMYGILVVIYSFFNLYFFADAFVFALLYIWCKRRPFQTIRLFFGFTVKSGYFPWVYMGFHVLMGSSFIIYIIGLILGHLYITVKDIYIPRYHKDYFPTPMFFKRWVAGGRQVGNVRGNVGQNVPPRQPQNFGGQGVRLG